MYSRKQSELTSICQHINGEILSTSNGPGTQRNVVPNYRPESVEGEIKCTVGYIMSPP